jgi:hypothetical protein
MNKLYKITFFFLFVASQSFCQDKDSMLIQDIETSEIENSITEEFKYSYVNKPSEDAIITFTKFISCFRFPDILRSSAPIQFTKQNLKGVKSIKVIDDGFTVPTYYAEFDTLGRYKKLDYYEVYASPPYFTLQFEYGTNGKFAEVLNTYENKNELFLEFYAIGDTIIQRFEYPTKIYPDAFDVYKRAFYDKDLQLFDFSKAVALDRKEQYCMSEGSRCTYSTLSKNVYRYDYSFEVDERNGHEIIYYNDKNQLLKIETFEKGGRKNTIIITYEYYAYKN